MNAKNDAKYFSMTVKNTDTKMELINTVVGKIQNMKIVRQIIIYPKKDPICSITFNYN